MEKTNKRATKKIAYMAVLVNIIVLSQNSYILIHNNNVNFILSTWLIFSTLYSIYNIGKVIKWFIESSQKPF